MPNKTMDFEVDILPEENGAYNLGTANKKWIVNGYELNDAVEKGVDSSIQAGSSSANLPTSAAVASFVEGKGYKTGPLTWGDLKS